MCSTSPPAGFGESGGRFTGTPSLHCLASGRPITSRDRRRGAMSVQTPVQLGDGEHVVQFYESEGELVTVVGGYLADAIDAGSIAVAVTTPAHSTAFERVLR